jgi:hypothetical protein
MTQPSSSTSPPALPRRINPRLVAMLAGLVVAISILVILTDVVSPRNRNPAGPGTSTSPATATFPATTRVF